MKAKGYKIHKFGGCELKTIVYISRKGGVGKTTSAVNTALGLPYVLPKADIAGRSRPRVLAIDLDQQRDLTKRFFGDKRVKAGEIEPNIIDFLTCPQDEESLMACVYNMRLCDVIPGSSLSSNLVNVFLENPLLLRERLAVISSHYDVCILDLPPDRDAVSFAALIASDYAIPCTDIHPSGVDGVEDTITDIKTIRDELGLSVHVPFIAVKSDPADLYSDEDVKWIRGLLARFTSAPIVLLQYDSRLLRDCAKSQTIIYGFPRKRLARVFANLCVQIAVLLLGCDPKEPGYAPFIYFYDSVREMKKKKVKDKKGDK